MPTKAYVIPVPRVIPPTENGQVQNATDMRAFQAALSDTLSRLDQLGETVIAVESTQAGWAASLSNTTWSGGPSAPRHSSFGGGHGYSYTDSIIIFTSVD
jgi:hypothetical protein